MTKAPPPVADYEAPGFHYRGEDYDEHNPRDPWLAAAKAQANFPKTMPGLSSAPPPLAELASGPPAEQKPPEPDHPPPEHLTKIVAKDKKQRLDAAIRAVIKKVG